MNRTRLAIVSVTALVAGSSLLVPVARASDHPGGHGLDGIDHIVVIYEENHSFDNLYGGWEGVDGLANATSVRTTQVNVAGAPYDCLKQNDVNLTSPTPLASACTDASAGTPGGTFASAFPNAPFNIDSYIAATDTTCPTPLKAFSFPNGVLKGAGLPGGCTRDMVHKFYQEQYQIDGGRQDRYVTGSDGIGLTMGYYDTTKLPIYRYLHGKGAPHYVVADNFFQAAFGGSFLNHQWLIAARTPVMSAPTPAMHSVLGADGHPRSYPLHPAAGTVDGVLTVAPQADGSCVLPAGLPQVCGDWAINTMTPPAGFTPTATFAPQLTPQTYDTIGDRLTGAGVDWAWYAGGWDNATGNTTGRGFTNGNGPACTDPAAANPATYPLCPDNVFQNHHQPFDYFANYGPNGSGRAHLQDEQNFLDAARKGKLKPVSFVKPLGEDNEHPGYTSEARGSNHLVDLIKAVMHGKDAEHTMIVVTYDEFGGSWDHVSPPTGSGVSDAWGPGTRVPALVISPELDSRFAVDHTSHDTTSILATIEHRFGLAPLGTRDAVVADLSSAFRAADHEDERGRGDH